MMEWILFVFCGESRKRINLSKPKLFVYDKSCSHFAQSLSCQFKVPLTRDLRTYLGVLYCMVVWELNLMVFW